MIERLCQLAERSATSASRRQFLVRAATWAGGLAAILAGLMAPRAAHGRATPGKINCVYLCGSDTVEFREVNCKGTCRDRLSHHGMACVLWYTTSVGC